MTLHQLDRARLVPARLRAAVLFFTALFVSVFIPTALHSAACSAAQPDIQDKLEKLFDAGAKNTPTTVEAARKEYEQLKRLRPNDTRIDYAYGVVLLNQRRYGDALALLAPYLDGGQAELGAARARIWVEIQNRRWTEALAAAERLADQFPKQAPAAEDQATQTARFLGAALGYLELARASAVDPAKLARCKAKVTDRLGETYQGAFDEGLVSVRDRFAEFQVEAKAASDKTAAAAAQRVDQEKAALDEVRGDRKSQDETLRATAEQQRGNRTQMATLQGQLTNMHGRQNDLSRQIMRVDSDIADLRKRFRTDKDISFSERQKLDNLNATLLDLNLRLKQTNREIATLQNQMATLAAKDQRDAAAMAETRAAAKKIDRKAKATADRIRQGEAKAVPKPLALVGKITMLSSYMAFPYAEERARVLGWYSK